MRSTLRIRSGAGAGDDFSDWASDFAEGSGQRSVLSSFSMQNALSRLSKAPLLREINVHTCNLLNAWFQHLTCDVPHDLGYASK